MSVTDSVEDAVVLALIVMGSLAALSLAAWGLWCWWGDDPLGINGLFKGE